MNRKERGYILAELLVVLAISSLVLTGGLLLLINGVKVVTNEIGDWELLTEVQSVTDELVKEIRQAKRVEVTTGGVTITKDKGIVYKCNSNGIIYRNNQPLTANTRLGTIKFTTFDFVKISKQEIKLHIKAVNTNSNTELEVENIIVVVFGEVK